MCSITSRSSGRDQAEASCLDSLVLTRWWWKVGQVAYELKLPASMRCHDVFHVSLLHQYNESGRCQPPPKTLMMDGSEEVEVEKILEHRTVSKGRKRVNQ